MSRAEVFEGTGPDPGHVHHGQDGRRQGRPITAAQAYLAYEAGAYPGSPVGAGAHVHLRPLRHPERPHRRLRRGGQQAEDRGLPRAGRDDRGLRRRDRRGRDRREARRSTRSTSASRTARRKAPAPTARSIRASASIETLEAAKHHPHYKAPLGGPNRGRGVASGFWFNVGRSRSASVSVNADGTVGLVEGSTDIGGSRTSHRHAAGRGARHRRRATSQPLVGDTDTVGYTDVTGGSRVTFATGWAAYEPAAGVISADDRRAPPRSGRSTAEDVTYEDGATRSAGDNAGKIAPLTFKELAAKAAETGGPIVGRAQLDPTGAGGGFATHIVDVEVDPRDRQGDGSCATPRCRTSARRSTPSYVEGQMQGGVAQGIGWALNEEYVYDKRRAGCETPASSTTACRPPRPADDRHGHRRGARTPATPTASAASARCRSCRRRRRSPTPSTTRSASASTSCRCRRRRCWRRWSRRKSRADRHSALPTIAYSGLAFRFERNPL